MQTLITDVASAVPGVAWSICIRSADGGVQAGHDADRCLSTASVGKLLLLVEVARRCETGALRPDELLHKAAGVAVGDSGLWQHLQAEALAVADLAVLVASVSDNWATNVLLTRVTLSQVSDLVASLGFRSTALTDRVRDDRGPGHPSQLSVGSARELSFLMSELHAGRVVSPAVSDRVWRWLATGVDLSMVASPLGLDPLAHLGPDRGLLLRNKTGTDSGVRADVGVLQGPASRASYAVIANWQESDPATRDDVLIGMRRIGTGLRDLVAQ